MKTTIWTVALALALAHVSYADDTAVAPAGANAPTAQGQGMEKRVENQHKRIDHLKEKGKISDQEASALNQKVDATAAKIEAAKKDGISQEERREIRQELKATRKELRKAHKSKK